MNFSSFSESRPIPSSGYFAASDFPAPGQPRPEASQPFPSKSGDKTTDSSSDLSTQTKPPPGTGPTWGTRGIRGWSESRHPLIASVPQEVGHGIVRVLAPNPGLMTGPGTNTYIVAAPSGAVVVDPGPADTRHIEAVETALTGRPCIAILLTHHHPDHAEGAAMLKERLGAPLLGHPSKLAVDIELEDGSCFDIGGEREILALHTPGHASDHLCFFVDTDGIVFTGDHLMGGNTSVIAPPDGSMADYIQSLRRLADKRPRYALPGHGQPVFEPIEAISWYIKHRFEREASILELLASDAHKEWSIPEIVRVVYTDVPPHVHNIAEFSVWAHLDKLWQEGRVRAVGGEGVHSLWKLEQETE